MVTGGQYGSNEGCQPYEIPKCNHHEPGPYKNCSEGGSTPKCQDSCISGYPKTYKEDKHFGASAYSVSSNKIQTEIMTNGPVEGAFSVYADFPTYRSGLCVYDGAQSVCVQCVGGIKSLAINIVCNSLPLGHTRWREFEVLYFVHMLIKIS